MKFFDRKEEIARLREIREKAAETARFTVVTGRRRVGKTQLIKRALEDRPYLYFYVARRNLLFDPFGDCIRQDRILANAVLRDSRIFDNSCAGSSAEPRGFDGSQVYVLCGLVERRKDAML